MASGPGGVIDDKSPELDVGANTITNAESIVASGGSVAGDDQIIPALNVDASGGFDNSGTISVAATTNLPSE